MAVDGVNNVTQTNVVGTEGVGGARYLGNDRDPASELETLLRGTFDFCESPEQVDGLVNSIVYALAQAGLSLDGPLMQFVQQLAAAAKARLGAGTGATTTTTTAAATTTAADGAAAADATTPATTEAVKKNAPTGALSADAAAAKELETLLYGAYASCTNYAQVANLTRQIKGALGDAGLETTGALPDYLDQLGSMMNQSILADLQKRAQIQADIDAGGAGSW